MSKPKYPMIAHCRHHDRLMNAIYIRRRKCLERRCKHFEWLDEKGGKQDERVARPERV